MPISVGNAHEKKESLTAHRGMLYANARRARVWVKVTASVTELSKVTPNLDG
jgi:hypothetical protein